MARYVDGFLLSVPTRKLEQYRRISKAAGKIWMEHGALQYVETVGDDLKVKGVVSFKSRAKARTGETVVFSWIAFKSRAHRDRVNAKVMKDPRIANLVDPKDNPFDMKRMAYGGFASIVDL